MSETCCPAMDKQWSPQVVDDQLADVQACVACQTVHRVEKYHVCLRFPVGCCVNCGGDLQEAGQDVQCTFCGRTGLEDQEAHERLAAIHPERNFLKAAEALAEGNRPVLALKLATAEIAWGQDPINGMQRRLLLLEQLGMVDQALDEAYTWADQPGAPPLVLGLISQLEAANGNLRGAMAALERGLHLDPENGGWHADYAEIMLANEDWGNAVRSASKGMHDAAARDRCVAVISEVGERFYLNEQYAEALAACSSTKEWQEQYVALAWLRARIAASQHENEYLVKWLEAVLKLDPEHAEAKAMLEPYQRNKRGGWFSWR